MSVQLQWGTNHQLHFQNQEEYYETLGVLARNELTKISWIRDDSTGIWGIKGQIICNFTPQRSFSVLQKAAEHNHILCNDFIQNLIQYHWFRESSIPSVRTVLVIPRDKASVKRTVPRQYWYDFERGYNR